MPFSPAESSPVALLYQAVAPPEIDGIRKPMKPGGYRDSGADIAFNLRAAGVSVVTPRDSPDPTEPLDWVFPDTAEGIAEALSRGARILWANTVLFSGHPLEDIAGRGVRVVCHPPASVDRYDDKWFTRMELLGAGCPVPAAVRVGRTDGGDLLSVDALSEARLEERGLRLPLVVKPVRGRGSEGVSVVRSLEELQRAASALLTAKDPALGTSRYGEWIILERFLPGTELTVTVLPPGTYDFSGVERTFEEHWVLPPIRRFAHQGDIAPYNGLVAVVENSVRLSDEERQLPALRRLEAACALAARAVGARAFIRIDCRADERGEFLLFDLNMKPNMTGPGRPGRDDQDSLCSLSALGVGWSYTDLLLIVLRHAWRLS